MHTVTDTKHQFMGGVYMTYIIMCGGNYKFTDCKKQLYILENGEKILERTIRLLREEGVTDIRISSNDPVFKSYGLPVIDHNNSYSVDDSYNISGYWVDAFYPTDYPVCYIFGDVVFSKRAIHTIVTTETDSIEFFASAPPFRFDYPKKWAEPFALKVVDVDRLIRSVWRTKVLQDQGAFYRKPIMWELWQVIKNTPLNIIDYTNYTVINDYTCDVDYIDELDSFKGKLEN